MDVPLFFRHQNCHTRLDTRCVKKSIQASRRLGVFGRCVIQGERRLLKSDQGCNAIECTSTFMRLWMLLYSKSSRSQKTEVESMSLRHPGGRCQVSRALLN